MKNVVFTVVFTIESTIVFAVQSTVSSKFHYQFQHDHFYCRLHLQNNFDPRQCQRQNRLPFAK